MTNTFLVGSNDPLEIDPASMRRALETDPASFQGIIKYGLTSAEAVLAHWVGDKDTLQRVIPSGPVNTFERPYYEFYSPADYAVPPNNRTLLNHEMLMMARGEGLSAFMQKGIAASGQMRAAIQARGDLPGGTRGTASRPAGRKSPSVLRPRSGHGFVEPQPA